MQNIYDKIQIDDLEEKIAEMGKSLQNKLEAFENKLDNQRKDLEEKNAKIAAIEIRLDEVDKKERMKSIKEKRKLRNLRTQLKP